MTNSIGEIEDSSCVFIIGSNTSACHPLIARRVIRAKEKGAKLIVADPRRIQLSRFADVALTHRLGSDVALLNGMMHLIIKNGWQDEEYIAARTENYELLAREVEKYDPKTVSQITGVGIPDLEKAAELYGRSRPASLLYAMGITQHSTGVDNVKSCCNIALLCGNVGVHGGGVNPLRGQNNVQGACDMGGLPNVFPGYQPVNDLASNKKFSDAWGAELPDKVGLTITDMIRAIDEGRLKALYIIGENPKLSDPDWNHFNHVLKKLDLLVVQDLFLSETAQVADVVLAAASVAEKDGTVTNSERRCMRVNQAIPPLGDCLPDWRIISRLSTAMGRPMEYNHPEEIFDEMKALTLAYKGMSYQRLGLDGLAWPCPEPDHPGTPYLHKVQFPRPGGKGAFHQVAYQDPDELPDSDYPFLLTTGRTFSHFHTGTMTRISAHLDAEEKDGFVEMNAEDMKDLDLHQGDLVFVTSRRGTMEAPVRFSEALDPGVMFLPIHFGENPANIVTNPAFDPIAKIPELKVSVVKVSLSARGNGNGNGNGRAAIFRAAFRGGPERSAETGAENARGQITAE